MGRMEAATKKPKVKATDVAYEPGLLVRLKDAGYAADYLAAIAEEGDPAAFLLALRQIAQAQGMAGVARRAKLGRESLYKALSEGGNPEWRTVAKLLPALGLRLSVAAV